MQEAVRKSPDKQTGEVHSNEVPSFPNVLSSHTALSYTCYGYYQHSPVLSRAVLEGFSAKEQDPVSDLLTSKERNHVVGGGCLAQRSPPASFNSGNPRACFLLLTWFFKKVSFLLA